MKYESVCHSPNGLKVASIGDDICVDGHDHPIQPFATARCTGYSYSASLCDAPTYLLG